MYKKFLNNIGSNKKIALYGMNEFSKGLYEFFVSERPDVKIVFVQDYSSSKFENVEILDIQTFVKNKESFDFVVLASLISLHEIKEFFSFFGIKCIIPDLKDREYHKIKKYEEKQKEAQQVFSKDFDKNLYNKLWDAIWCNENHFPANYSHENHNISSKCLLRNYEKQYMEFIDKGSIKTMVDGGFCNGINSFVFFREFKNLKKLLAYEPMYEKFKNPIYDSYISQNECIKIFEKGLWSSCCELEFCENTIHNSASRVLGTKGKKQPRPAEVVNTISATTIDYEKEENNIEKIDFIKLDVEGAEMEVLKGAKNTIEKDRPQMAISIYHSFDDFVSIPLYLHEELSDYSFRLGHYSYDLNETVLYAIPNELDRG